MVYRVYVEKKEGLRHEASGLLSEIRDFLGIKGVSDIRLLNRYDAEGLDAETFERAIPTVFSEPQVDVACSEMPKWEAKSFAVEYLPGQYDQRADSAAQCVQIMAQSERPVIRTAKLYYIFGDVSDEDVERIKKYVINPVEARQAAIGPAPATLKT
ncbi:MAG: phosphoribosylformylglycinamidine synthase, partial [Oscillospiraceae bacterium]|nr:phosphoribosylformylglycinamidine synthase [Oscillospiraceae bacterium]